EVGVHPQPVHLARARDLLLADDGDVVLGLAGDDAGIAADTGCHVNRHPPLVAAPAGLLVLRVVPLRIHRLAALRLTVLARGLRRLLLVLALGRERRVARPLAEGAGADDLAPLHAEV